MMNNFLRRFLTVASVFLCMSANFALADNLQVDFARKIAAIETEVGGRIGVAVHGLGNHHIFGYKADQRFSMSSTFKALLCGAILARVDNGQENPNRIIPYSADQLVAYSPVTEKHADQGMTVAALCEATVTISDNTAANLLLDTIGGPAGFTQYLRDLGDDITRLDRWETALNQAEPGDLRDTTTPKAVLTTLEKLAFQDHLSRSSRAQLRQWMIDDKVADALLRSVLPMGWKIGDKTGAGGHGARGIIAIVWPTKADPFLVAIYLAENEQPMDQRNQAIAQIGAVIFDLMQLR